MARIFLTIFLTITLFTFSASQVIAIEDPFAVPNNKYGIHILEETDLEGAADLVNSNGGDWGYVTIVIAQNDRDPEKWQRIFTKMTDLHLIPLVRIASTPIEARWEKLEEAEIDNWLNFLSELPWPTKNRYIIVGNEPNHAKEWGGKVNPEEYASYLKVFSEKAKLSSKEYFILPAGFDASAPNLLGYMSEDTYIKKMVTKEPTIFDHIDGWVSHSYPNPAFSGNEKDVGRGTIRTFEWEIEYLKTLGLTKELPIFITETGWIHDMDGRFPILTDTSSVGGKLKYAYENVWNNEKIVAVTPFLLNYQSFPFETFSWKSKSGTFYSFYFDIQSLPKTGGNPKRIQKNKPTPKKKSPPALEFAGIFFNTKNQSVYKDTMKSNLQFVKIAL